MKDEISYSCSLNYFEIPSVFIQFCSHILAVPVDELFKKMFFVEDFWKTPLNKLIFPPLPTPPREHIIPWPVLWQRFLSPG